MLVGLAIGSVGQELFNGTPLVTDTGWVAGFAVSAVLIRVIGRRLNACGDLHTLYDMPMQHWWWLGVACSALTPGIVILIRSVWSPRPGLAAPSSTTRPQWAKRLAPPPNAAPGRRTAHYEDRLQRPPKLSDLRGSVEIGGPNPHACGGPPNSSLAATTDRNRRPRSFAAGAVGAAIGSGQGAQAG
jgi:hypothetical protein